jgi:hypothetical protein
MSLALFVTLAPLAPRGQTWILAASIVLSVVMIGNALGHVGASLYWGRLAPGVYSSPFVFITSLALLVTALRARVRGA